MVTSHDYDQTSESFFRENGIRQVKLWEWQPSNINKYFKDLKVKLKSFYPGDEVDKFLKRSTIYLCKNWFCTFK